MISRQQQASRASSRRGVVGGKRNWATNMLFWLLFVTDVFAVCFWPTSKVGELLVQLGILALKPARVLVVLLSAFLTPAVIRGIISLLKRTD